MKEYGDKHPKMKRRSILSLNPPDHTRIRNLASRSFTPRAIEQLKPFIENLSENLLRPNGTHEIDLITQFAAPLPAYVIAKLMGVPEKDMPRFKILSDEFAKLLNPLSSDDDIYNGFVAKGELGKYFSDLMEIKERNPSDDLLSKMVTDMEGGYNITVEELLTLCTLLLVAGHETTTNLIGNGFYALMKNREQMNMLIDDRSLIKNAIEEMLRYDPPVQMVGRVSMTDNASIEGLDVAKNKFIAVMVGSANHDEEIFNEPEKFDITRKEIRHLSFSEGIHFCLGAPLARVEGAIAFDKLLDHLKGGKIIEQPRYRGNYNMRGLEHLRISF
jgi:cytochrome P450